MDNRKRGKGSTLRVGSADDLIDAKGQEADRRGYTDMSERHIQMVADSHGVKVVTRPTNPFARDWLESGRAVAKEQIVKNKSISDLDTLIGAKKEHRGLVAHFNPVKPDKGQLDDTDYQRAYGRYLQRKQEYIDQGAYLKKMKDHLEVKDGLVIDKKSGLPITGDVDGFVIRGLHNEVLPQAVVKQVEGDLFGRHAGPQSNVRHGFHIEWDRSKDSTEPGVDGGRSKAEINAEIDKKIRDSHRNQEVLNIYTAQPGTSRPDPTPGFWRGA